MSKYKLTKEEIKVEYEQGTGNKAQDGCPIWKRYFMARSYGASVTTSRGELRAIASGRSYRAVYGVNPPEAAVSEAVPHDTCPCHDGGVP